MKVLLLDVNCKYSSTGKIVYDLYTQLRADGHEAAIGYGRGPLVEGENIYRFSPKWEVYLHALLTRLTGYTGCFSPVATKRLIRFMEEFQPDVVHLNDMHGYFVNIIPLIEYLKKKKIRTVWTQHCEFLYTGKCGYAYECDKWQTECGHCPHLRDYPKVACFDRTKKMFEQKKRALEDFEGLVLAAPSEWLADRIRRSFLKDRELHVIYNGIDTTVFRKTDASQLREKYGIKDEKIVLAVAPDLMSERKGGEHVLELARLMRDNPVKFLLVGVEDTEKIQEENVIAVEPVRDQKLLAQYYSMADVFVICSKRENYPTTCIEAAACGAPVAGFDAGGTKETVSEGAGIFVEYGDIKGLKSALEEILFSAKKLPVENKKDYSVSYMCMQYEKLYWGEE